MSNLHQVMLDHSPHMMLLVGPSTLRIMLANRVVAHTLGYREDQLAGMSITEIESSLQDVFYWEDVRNGQVLEIASQEGEYLCADGSLRTVAKSVSVIDHGGVTLLLVQARDIGNQRQVEDVLAQTLSQLRATLESTGNGILVIDWHGRIASMNRLFSSMWELPEDLLLARDDAAILDYLASRVTDGDACRTRLQEVVDGSESGDLLELRDGRVFECMSRPQYLGERIIGRVFGYTDITERRRAEQALRESRDLLEARVLSRTADLQRANATLETEQLRQQELIRKLGETQSQLLQSEKMASIGVLAAGVAHEINNPIGFVNSNLNSLQRYCESMLALLDAYERSEPSLAPRMLDEIRRLKVETDASYLREDIGNLLAESMDGLERVMRIVRDMKDFSHVDASGQEYANLESGLDSTLNVVWHEIKYKAEVVKEFGDIPRLECFPSQLNQVFMNLLVNAAHAIDVRGVITIRTGHDGANVWVEVEDTGKGIPSEHLGRIFEPFFTTKPVGMGTGLGLSLSYGIVQKHGGRIEVRSELHKGSVFKVVLPQQRSPQASMLQ